MYKHRVDARHLICPMPVIKTQDAIATLQQADLVQVLATDKGTKYDIPAWVRVHGHELISVVENNENEIEFVIAVKRGKG